MNIFILVEGKTERKIYPKWLAQLVPHLLKVDRPDLVRQNNYCVVSGNGYPSILTYLEQSIDEINNVGRFDFLVVVADADDKTVAEREAEIHDYLVKNAIKLNAQTRLIIILQRCCIETWLLGNRRIFKKNVQDLELSNWIKQYNVSVNDPELMPLPVNYDGAIGHFHKMYLKRLLNERHVIYTETQVNAVIDVPYLNELSNRFSETRHIATFGNFLNFCKKLNLVDN
jgi:hypothetical protein